MDKIALLVVNFGGPRNVEEVPLFLEDLLTDKDVIRTPLPGFLQDWFFKRIARKRSKKVAEDYEVIGGKSPIYEDTEWVSSALGKAVNLPSVAFHRYLRDTHKESIDKLEAIAADEVWVFPLFPQFSYATTGSIARWFKQNTHEELYKKMKWVESYSSDERYISSFTRNIHSFLEEKKLKEEETVLLFSAHGLPESFIQEGDPYQRECQESFHKISKNFPRAHSILSYQSKFGRAKWIEPSTIEMCNQVKTWIGDKRQIVFIPLSFTSDHIETLFEVEQEYMLPLQEAGYAAYRCPALGRREDWVEAMKGILLDSEKVENAHLIRTKNELSR
jgi:protoporphyrin/coproporphyrin ferrochelatase